ncbi:hypothetical protein XENORESO_003085 [Xenotaenia resolanae]|uniref:RRM domain-containing protein n=1 Tax=Xenotaenia resolanae TaxID=208358 RepID=A0ABV0VNL6_9TELE
MLQAVRLCSLPVVLKHFDRAPCTTSLPQSGSWQDLKDHMREAGDVCYADVYRDGTGVVEFVRKEDMTYAVRKLDNTKFRSHERQECCLFNVKFSCVRQGETAYIRVKLDGPRSPRPNGFIIEENETEDQEVGSKDGVVDAWKAVIKNADMSEDMQQDAVDCATQAMEKYNIEKDIAAYIKKEFDKKYNPTWHCIVGRNFGSYVTHETKHFIYFYLGQVAILLFKSG